MDWFLYDSDLRHERVKTTPRILSYYLPIILFMCPEKKHPHYRKISKLESLHKVEY